MEKLEAVEERASAAEASGKVGKDIRTKAEIAFEKVQEKRVGVCVSKHSICACVCVFVRVCDAYCCNFCPTES